MLGVGVQHGPRWNVQEDSLRVTLTLRAQYGCWMAGRRKTITWIVTPSGCHECTSHSPDKGTGYPRLNHSNMHRVLYEEAYGPMPVGYVGRHTCDNPLCINLEHIVLGTPKDNSNDMKVRGRCNTTRGEHRSDAKLTSQDVHEIRCSDERQQVLADRYGVSQPTISRIKSYQKRQHEGHHRENRTARSDQSLG